MFQALQFASAMILGLSEKRRSEEGATAVEYGLLVALIAAAIVGVVLTLGGDLVNTFTGVSGAITDAGQ